jgi:NCAIR mutase (PurE)-related protein
VRSGALEVDAALERMRHLPYEELGFAKLDHHRALRHGMPEVVFAQGKTPEEVLEIARRLLEISRNMLITRADAVTAARVLEQFPEAEHFPRFGAILRRIAWLPGCPLGPAG